MPGLKTYLTLLCLALVFTAVPGWSLQNGTQLPELSGTSLSGDLIELNQLKGQPLLLKVGTTWCPTCSQQSHEITHLTDFLRANNIQFIDIFIQEPADTVERYFKQSDYLHPDSVILDSGTIGRALNIYLVPRLILVDKNFTIVRDGGPLMADDLKELLEKMLAD